MKKYQSIRKDIKSGDLLEWRASSVLGWIIRKFTKKNVNHSSLCISLPQYQSWKDHHKFILEANPGGIELQLISRRLSTFKGSVFYYPLIDSVEESQRKIMEAWALTQVGKKYDFKSLFRNAVSTVNIDARAWFCSEFYTAALIQAGLISNKTEAMRPGDFAQFGLHKKPIVIL